MVSRPRWESPVTSAEMRAGDGAAAIDFIQRHCRITKDTVAGKRGESIRLRDWQQLQLYRLLARRDDGGRKHRVGLLGLPRKNGKSAVASGLALWMADEGPAGGEVYCCAGDKDQAKIVFATCKSMVELDPELSSRVSPFRDELIWPATETKLKALSAEAYTKEGLNPTGVVFDEVHVQPDDELWDVMALAMGAREEPLMFGITTAGDPTDRHGSDSLCYRLYQHGRKVASGETPDPSFYFSWWEPTPTLAKKRRKIGDEWTTETVEVVDHRSPAVWDEANPGLGDLVAMADFESAVVRTGEQAFKTKRCNIWYQGKGEKGIPDGTWEPRYVVRPSAAELVRFGSLIEVPSDWLADAVAFLDGSWSGDSTGIVCCTRDAHLFVVTHHEKTELDDHDWRVPVNSVKDDIRLAFKHGLRGLAYDPFRWQQTATDLIDEGYPVVEWPTNSLARIVPAWKDFRAAVLDGELTHDGNPALQRHIYNVVVKDPEGNSPRPVKASKNSLKHIDLAICGIGAWANRALEFTEAPKRATLWSAVA